MWTLPQGGEDIKQNQRWRAESTQIDRSPRDQVAFHFPRSRSERKAVGVGTRNETEISVDLQKQRRNKAPDERDAQQCLRHHQSPDAGRRRDLAIGHTERSRQGRGEYLRE